METQDKFWIVWNPGYTSSVRHPAEEQARIFAEESAKKHPGEVFVVMEAKAGFVTTTVQQIKYEDPTPF